MRKLLSIITVLVSIFSAVTLDAQCYTATYGLWPSATFTPTCNGSFANITTAGYASEYSNVNLVAGNTYVFRSSVSTDYITVDNNGLAPLVGVMGVSGTAGVSWTCTVTGTYRFYTHTNAACGSATSLRTRSISCSAPASPSSNCTNTTSFGSAAINTNGGAVTISGCSYAGEYSTISGAVNGQTLRFTSSAAGDYITVRSGSATGAVVAQGTTPLTFTNTFTGTLYVHWNTANSCGTQSSCRTTTVECTSCTPPPAPSNDLCGGSTNMSCGSTVTVNTVNANTDAAGSNLCGTTITTPGVWFKVTGNGQIMTASTVGLTSSDTKIMVFSGNCAALSCIGGSDDFSGLQSQVSWNSTVGTTYYILAALYSGTGSFPMSLNCVAPYNACNSVTNIAACGSSQNINIPSGNGSWDGYGSPFTTPGQEQIFTFTPAVSGNYPITVTNNGSGWIDLFVKTTTSGCNNTGWTYIDDISGTVTNVISLTAGVTYYFLLDDEDVSGSTGSISVACPCFGNSNDGTYTYSSAFSISGNTVGACDDSPLRASADRIYAVNISCAGSYTFSLCGGASWDTYLYLTTAAGGGGTVLASNDDACSLQSSLTASLNAGTYYIVVEGFSSTSEGAFTLNVSGSGAAPSITGSNSNVSCNGGSNGSITASVNGNGNAATATLNGNAFNGSATGLAAGTYTVVATNCWGSTSQTFTVTEPTALAAASTSGSIACNGGSTTVTVSASGGTAPYSGTGSFTVTAGTYSYTVTDANGCTSTTSITVSEPTALSAASTSGSIACNGGSTTVTVSANGGTAPYSGTGSFTVTAGTYSYTVTDANGCTSTTSITVSEPTALSAASTSGSIACNGGSTTVTVSANGGTTPYSGDGNYTVTAGTYSYTVTDANGCTASTSISVTEPTLLTAANVASDYNGYGISCNGGSNGSITVSANGGTAPYSGDGANTGLSAGTYSYTVTDANGCTASTSATLSEPTALGASNLASDFNGYGVSCNGGSNGSVTVSATGGVAPYSGDGANTGLSAGTYSYTVTDANGCTASTSATITEPTDLVSAASAGQILCFGGSTNVGVSATGGVAPYTGTGNNVEVAGTYNYTVTDANGCTDVATVTITQPDLLVASSSSGAIACFGGSTTVTVAATGGTAPYVNTGNYTVTAGTSRYVIQDANGCTALTTITVTQPDLLVASFTAGTIACFGATTPVTVSAVGGTQPYTGTGTFNTPAGATQYTVRDANGCTSSVEVRLGQPSQLRVNAGQDQRVYYGYAPMSCATLNASASGGTGSATYQWFDGNGNLIASGASTTVCPSSTTNYTVVATDANGCTASDVVAVCVTDVTCSAGTSNTIKVQVCTRNNRTLCVDASAVPSHLRNGATLGSCSERSCTVTAAREMGDETIAQEYSSDKAAGELLDVQMFPNPSSSYVNISINAPDQVFEIQVFDAMGRLVNSIKNQSADRNIVLNMTDVPSGVYMVRISGENGFVVKQLVKE